MPLDPAERLKNTMVEAFRRQRQFMETFSEQFPTIQERLIKLAEISAGATQTGDDVAEISADLKLAADSLQSLAAMMEKTVTEASVATMKLKEIEGEPEDIAELMIDQATVLANAPIFMESSAHFINQMLERALPKPRNEALRMLPPRILNAWLDDILEIAGQEPEPGQGE